MRISSPTPFRRVRDPTGRPRSSIADGLIDPDRLAAALLEGLHHAFDAMELGSTRFIELENVEFVLPEGGRMRNIFIADARLHQVADGELSITAQVEIDSRTLSLDGTAKRDSVSRRISSLDLHLTAPADNVVSDAEPLSRVARAEAASAPLRYG